MPVATAQLRTESARKKKDIASEKCNSLGCTIGFFEHANEGTNINNYKH
jgi:hypothetical protein